MEFLKRHIGLLPAFVAVFVIIAIYVAVKFDEIKELLLSLPMNVLSGGFVLGLIFLVILGIIYLFRER